MSLIRDVRLALRHLLHAPGYTATAVLTLAVAMGANSAIFSAVRAVLLQRLPILSPEHLTVSWQTDEGGQAVIELTHRHLREWMASNPPFERASLMASHNWSGILQAEGRASAGSGGGEPTRIWYAGVSGSFFETMGVPAALGRTLQPFDDVPNGPAIAVLNHGAWVRRFAADPAVVGSTMNVDGRRMTIVGVMPAGFDVPRGAEYWTPTVPILASGTPPNTRNLDAVGLFYVVGRSRPGLAPDDVRAGLQAIEARLDAANPGRFKWGPRMVTTPLLDHMFGPMRSALWALWAAVGVLLLVACANVSGLMLTRVSLRHRENGVRLALGASRFAIGRLWLVEVLLIALAGGVLGLAAAAGLARAIVALAPDDLPRIGETSIDATVALFTFGAVVVAALLSGAVSIRSAGRVNLVETLDGSRTTSSRRALHARSGLLVVQIAFAVVLLVAAGLVVRSFVTLRTIDLGFAPDRVLTANIEPRGAAVPPNRWMHDLLTRARMLPGVEAAGAVYLRPLVLGPIGAGVRVFLEGQPETAETGASNPVLNYQAATPGYFETMRIPLRAGRVFTDQDTASVSRVAIVAESTARRLWPGQDPLGKRLSMATFTPGQPGRAWRTVVGVVSDVRYRGLDEVQLDVYDPALQVGQPARHVVIRTSGDPTSAATALRQLARELDSAAVVDGVTTMAAVVRRAEAPWRLTLWMFVLFAGIAFGLAALGLFSLVALDVAHRRREFAIRLALGSSRAGLVRSVLIRAGWRVAAGVGAGFLVAVLATRAMRSLLFEVAPDDSATYAAVLAVIFVAVTCAAYLPARRAAGGNPQSLLRDA